MFLPPAHQSYLASDSDPDPVSNVDRFVIVGVEVNGSRTVTPMSDVTVLIELTLRSAPELSCNIGGDTAVIMVLPQSGQITSLLALYGLVK